MHLFKFYVLKWQLSVIPVVLLFRGQRDLSWWIHIYVSKLNYMYLFSNKYVQSCLYNLINRNCIVKWQMKDKEKKLAQAETPSSVPTYHSVTQPPRVECESNVSVLRVLVTFFRTIDGSTIISIPLLEMYWVRGYRCFSQKERLYRLLKPKGDKHILYQCVHEVSHLFIFILKIR